MNAHSLAVNAYASATRPIRTHKDTEYDVFARVTGVLQSVANTDTAPMTEVAEALYDNRRLWTLLAADVAGESNSLNRQTRAQIFYLAEFTEHHSRKVLKGEASVQPLIDINTAIMRGLRQNGGGK